MGLLTTGRSVSCEQGTCAGGAGKLYLANANQVSGITTSTATSSVTAITMGSTAFNFYEFEFRDFSASFSETSTQDQDTLAVQVEQTFTGIWTCRNQGDRDILQNLLDQNCGVVAVHVENTGVYWIWGVEVVGGKKLPSRLTSSEATSGTALTDPNQSTITITCRTNKMARELVNGETVMSALI